MNIYYLESEIVMKSIIKAISLKKSIFYLNNRSFGILGEEYKYIWSILSYILHKYIWSILRWGDLACNPGMCPDWESNQ